MTIDKALEVQKLLSKRDYCMRGLDKLRKATYALRVTFEEKYEPNGTGIVGNDTFFTNSVEYKALEKGYLDEIARIEKLLETDY